MELDEFRRHAHHFVDWMADYLAEVEQRPVRSALRPGAVLAQLPTTCPAQGEALETIFEDFKSIILPGITHWQHPSFFAYFNANSSPPSVLAEMLTATLAAQCMLWETSPAANELEGRMLEWLRDLIGLPETFTGSIQDTASTATLCALIAARERATGGQAARDGLSGLAPLTVYASAEAHSSVEKAAKIAGLGSAQMRPIPVDQNLAMDVEALAQAIATDRQAGFNPACIVACLGTTGTGAMDPLGSVAAVARRENIFLHVDAAWAGSALILPETRHLIAGIEAVDSFVFNPHKWLFTNFDCSAFYMQRPEELARALSLTPVILESPVGQGMPEYRDWGVALGRRFRALKLWFVLRSYGAEKLRSMLRSHIRWTQDLAQRIEGEPDFELTTLSQLALISFRYHPAGLDDEQALDRINAELLDRINDDGRIYLSKTQVRGQRVLRFAIGQTYTQERHVDQAWAVIRELARDLE